MVFSTGISGIQAAQKQLEITGNNIANASTVGFKSSRGEFADLYSAGPLGGGSNTVGTGVRLANIKQNFGQGTKIDSNNALDLRINGSGLFVLQDQGAQIYSRAGQFHIDNQGYIINNYNQRLVGYSADASGNISSVSSNLQVDTSNIPANASTTATAGFNLDSNSTPPTVAWPGGASPASDTYNYTSSMTVYDSLGNEHTLSMYFIKADAAGTPADPNGSTPASTNNQWYVAFQIDGTDVPALGGTENSANLNRVNFNSDGSFSAVAGAQVAGGLINLTHTLSNGAANLAIAVDLSDSTQFGSLSGATRNPSTDGYTSGEINGLGVDDAGVIFASYNNGVNRALGQVQLANFTNLDGLQQLGNTSWAETAASGQPILGNPGAAGLGLIESGALENSNVDLTSSLVDLIGAQRNFQANAQTIRTADAVTQTIINIR
ncbi:flagellar hook protein FlgE [Legionella sp. W05-934-2]|jgi:flagellar hook protein FlgE|uniref:flagellar hook protein FlgE n=1 Tax=Legionella sp. W05-934-2 TaxID=1198649 RepID=UPI0034623A23